MISMLVLAQNDASRWQADVISLCIAPFLLSLLFLRHIVPFRKRSAMRRNALKKAFSLSKEIINCSSCKPILSL